MDSEQINIGCSIRIIEILANAMKEVSMKSLEKIFHYQNRNIRTVLKDCEPWFVAADVCGVLGLDTTQAVNGTQERSFRIWRPGR